MSKLDRLKEEIAYQKYYLSVAIAIVVGLSGWLGVHVKSADSSLIIAGSIVVIFSSFFAYTRHKRIYQLLQEIEDA
ncbi:MAG: hypothetical protein V3V18_09725 [Methylococcales bacterium]